MNAEGQILLEMAEENGLNFLNGNMGMRKENSLTLDLEKTQ